jgi:arabinogalactan endo-1,4-beta-galactosidase
MCPRILLTAAFLLPFTLAAQTATDSFIRGADISFTPQIEDLGGKYTENGAQKDLLDILKKNGVNYVRLRLWHTPIDGYCGLQRTLAYAVRIKSKGFKFLLDFHYSDSWADPSKQTKPAAWANLSFADLKDSVYAYSKNVVAALKNQGTEPDMVQIGNEITGGMLWPDGKISVGGWQQFADLVKQGILGVKDGLGSDSTRIMIHIDRGGDNATATWFFDNLLAQKVQFDVIGLSYYPWWHGSLAQAKSNLNSLAARYNKDIVIAETAYPWTLQYADNVGNLVGSSSQLQPGYPATVKGQKDFLFSLIKIMKETSNRKCIGFFYWEPAYISVQPIGSSWENCTTFGFTGNATSSLTAFYDLDTLHSSNVTVRINTATLGDTLGANGFVQVRGEVQGICSNVLPSSDVITWDGSSQMVLNNVGGDNWIYHFKMYAADQLQFKLWSGFDANTATYRNLGWEGPITPFDSSNNNVRLFVAGSSDTTLEIQYYNSAVTSVNQYWSPITPRKDSLGVFFRTNVSDLMRRGILDPVNQGPVAVRGDSVSSGGVLSWTTSNVFLQREALSVANGSFWSGVIYYPKSKISAGSQIRYRFYIENSPFGGRESNITDRSFNFPSSDTTLAWRFFNDRNLPTGIAGNQTPLPTRIQLYPNFPNPFNPETIVQFSIPRRLHILVNIYNTLGQRVRTLVDGLKDSGTFSVLWDGTDGTGTHLSSGVYLVRMSAGNEILVQKALLLK